MHAVSLVLMLATAATGSPAEPPEAVDAASIPNYRLIHSGLATAGQPAPEAMAKLRDMGFRTVVNLRTEGEGGAGERAVVEAQGLRYVWVPITAESFSLADVEAVENVLRDPSSGPVLIHCASSNRVGAVWAAVQAREGKPIDEALAAGRQAGLRSPQLETAVRRILGLPVESAP